MHVFSTISASGMLYIMYSVLEQRRSEINDRLTILWRDVHELERLVSIRESLVSVATHHRVHHTHLDNSKGGGKPR